MFGFFKRKRRDRVPFDSFLMERSLQDTTLSLEDVLTDYIRTYGLAVRVSLDEPEKFSLTRTKLQILEELILAEPDFYKDEKFRTYIEMLRSNVAMFNLLPPAALKRMKERESQG